MSDFPKEYGRPMKPVIWLWVGAFALCGFCLVFPNPFFFLTNGHPRSPKSGCISNQKQIILSQLIYMSDYNDTFPPYFSFDGTDKHRQWIAATLPYLKNKDMLLCPVERESKSSSPSTEGIPGEIDYVHCLSLTGVIPRFSTGNRILDTSLVKNPATTPYLRDVIRGYENKDGPRFTSSHGGTFAVSYLDGHVKSVKLDINKDL